MWDFLRRERRGFADWLLPHYHCLAAARIDANIHRAGQPFGERVLDALRRQTATNALTLHSGCSAMGSLSKSDEAQLKAQLEDAVISCNERCLYQSAKWSVFLQWYT
jgi:hypothetical protein